MTKSSNAVKSRAHEAEEESGDARNHEAARELLDALRISSWQIGRAATLPGEAARQAAITALNKIRLGLGAYRQCPEYQAWDSSELPCDAPATTLDAEPFRVEVTGLETEIAACDAIPFSVRECLRASLGDLEQNGAVAVLSVIGDCEIAVAVLKNKGRG